MSTLSDIANHIKDDKTALTNLSDVSVQYLKGIPANTTGGSWYVDNASGVTDADTSIPSDFGSYDWQITQFATKNGADKFQFGTNGASMYIRSNDGGNTSTSWSEWTKLVYMTASWRSGNSWYRKYSDGWIEQGGSATTSTTINITTTKITFTTPFTSTINVLGGFVKAKHNAPFGQLWFQSGDATLTGFVGSVVAYNSNGNANHASSGGTCYWYASGY